MSEKIKILVVDDESLARKRITNLLKGTAGNYIVFECKNGFEAIELLTNENIDILFLDIQMPEINGFDVIENIETDRLPIIIFVTAYDQYALKAFEIHAVDYLLKPFDDDRFYLSLKHAVELLNQKESKHFNKKLIDLLNDNKNGRQKISNRILIKNNQRIYFVNSSDITRIKASGKFLEIYANKTVHNIRVTMQEMEAKLDPEKFLRIHRSTIINIDKIKEIQHWYKNEYMFILSNDEKFISGSTYRKNLNRLLDT